MDLKWEPYVTEVEDMVDVEVAALDKKAEERMQKKAAARAANLEYLVPMKDLMSRMDNFEAFMNHWEVRFETIERLVFEIYNAIFPNNASVPNKEAPAVEHVDEFQQSNPPLQPIILEVSLEVTLTKSPAVGTEVEVGSIRSYSASPLGGDNGTGAGSGSGNGSGAEGLEEDFG
jgi:hypothetical protein